MISPASSFHHDCSRSRASSSGSSTGFDEFRTVTFHTEIEIREVDRRTPDEKEACWLSDEDYISIRSRARREIDRHDGSSSTLNEDENSDHEIDDENCCARGLEMVDDESLTFIHRTRLTAVKAVLQVQNYQLQQSSLGTSMDPQAIADVYAECSVYCKEMAYAKATQDEEDIQNYLAATRKEVLLAEKRNRRRRTSIRKSRSAKLLLAPCKRMKLPRMFPARKASRKHSI